MLLQQRQGEAIQASKVLAHVRLSDERLAFAVDHIQAPMTAILDPPMTADRTRELLYAHRQAADVITRLDGFFTVTHANQSRQANRLQTFPYFQTLQLLGHWHLHIA